MPPAHPAARLARPPAPPSESTADCRAQIIAELHDDGALPPGPPGPRVQCGAPHAGAAANSARGGLAAGADSNVGKLEASDGHARAHSPAPRQQIDVGADRRGRANQGQDGGRGDRAPSSTSRWAHYGRGRSRG